MHFFNDFNDIDEMRSELRYERQNTEERYIVMYVYNCLMIF